MNPDKQIIIDQLLERVNQSPFVLVVDYNGMTVPQFGELRNRLTENGAECHVAKTAYMKRVFIEAELPDIGEVVAHVADTIFVSVDLIGIGDITGVGPGPVPQLVHEIREQLAATRDETDLGARIVDQPRRIRTDPA